MDKERVQLLKHLMGVCRTYRQVHRGMTCYCCIHHEECDKLLFEVE